MDDLTKKKCVPCEMGEGRLGIEKIKDYLKECSGWLLIGDTIAKEYIFKGFKEAMRFVLKISELAEKEGHHPDIFISYNKVRLTLSTHSAGGLTENDFILAAKVNQIQYS